MPTQVSGSDDQRGRGGKVVLAARVAPAERDLARLATEVSGERSLSAFCRRAVRDAAIRVVVEKGVPPEVGARVGADGA